MSTIIFFDINGTIIKRDSRTDIPYQKAIDLHLQVTDGMKGVDTSARSDKDVFMEVLERFGQSFTDDLWQGFLTIYQQQLEAFKTTDVWRENADAVSFIEKLAQMDVKLALITGELSIGAQYKLEKLGVWKHFPTGGFGEDGLRRFDIAESALKKAQKIYQTEHFDHMYVIGDTLLDIQTARHLGAKVISITTGSNTRDELTEANPDYLIDTFKDLEAFNLFL